MKTALNHNQDMFYKLISYEDDQIDKTILKDIERTKLITTDKSVLKVLSEKQKKLFNVLKAYAVYDKKVNYVQGTNYIVAVLLSNINSQRLCFWTFVQLMYEKNWRYLYLNNTPKLMHMLDILAQKIKKTHKDLYDHFAAQDVF